MTVKTFSALLAAGAFTLALSPASASPALLNGLSVSTAGLIQLGEGCEGGKCKGEKGEKGEVAPAEGAASFSSMIALGEGCEGGKCKGEKGEKGEVAPAEGATSFSSVIALGEGCEGGKCKGEKGGEAKGEQVPA